MVEYILVKDLEKGFYVISKPSDKFLGLIDHSAILDIGNSSRLGDDYEPAVIHFNPKEGIRLLPLSKYPGEWKIWGMIPDTSAALSRMKSYIKRKGGKSYDAITNNCETFVSYVAYGKEESPTINNLSETLIDFAVDAIFRYT